MDIIERYVRQLSDEEISQIVGADVQEYSAAPAENPVRKHAQKLMRGLGENVPGRDMIATLRATARRIRAA